MKEDSRAEKAKLDRERFEKITKVETTPLIVKRSSTGRVDLRSPEERQTGWTDDPLEIAAEKRRLARKARRERLKSQESDPSE